MSKKQQMMNSTMLSSETGRSMVEMLGVLAIIGVLSVGGIAGYTMAMKKHKANELLNEASLRSVIATAQIASGTAVSIDEFTDPTGYKFGITTEGLTNQYKLTLKTSDNNVIDSEICQQIKNILGDNHTNPSVNTDCSEFTYNNDLGENSSESETPEQAAYRDAFENGCSGDDCPPGIRYAVGDEVLHYLDCTDHQPCSEAILQELERVCEKNGWCTYTDGTIFNGVYFGSNYC